MRTHLSRTGKYLLLFVFLAVLVACAGQEETTTANTIIRKKIVAQQGLYPDKVLAENQTPQEAPEAEEPVIDDEVAEAETESPASESELTIGMQIVRTDNQPMYDISRRTNPFAPMAWARERQETDSPEDIGCSEIVTAGDTPLERFHLDQLKLTGIVNYSGGSRGLVEDPQGKPYIISRGTRIGTNAGKVTDIFEDRIVIEEKFIDPVDCEISYQNKVVTLNKPEFSS